MSSTTSNIASPLVATSAPSPLLRWSKRVVLAGVGFTALMGVLHMPFAAPLMRAVLPASFCPVQHGTPAQIDRGHEITAAAIRSSATQAAPARPALGFALDQSTKQDLSTWAEKHEVSCKPISGNDNLQKCSDVPAEAVGQDASFGKLEEVTFEFRSTGELTTVQTMRRGLTAPDAARISSALEKSAAALLGEPSTTGGEATAEHLSAGFMRTFVAEHRFTDYRAKVSATNMAHTGVMVREDYTSAK